MSVLDGGQAASEGANMLQTTQHSVSQLDYGLSKTFFSGALYPLSRITTHFKPPPFDLISAIVLLAVQLDPDILTSEFILMRNRFRLVCQDLTDFVDKRPIFWSRIALTARSPLPFVQHCLSRSGTLPITVSFRVHDTSPNPCYNAEWQPCTFIDYVEDASLLADEMDRCARLSVVGEDHICVSIVFDTIEWAEPRLLQSVDTAFDIKQYSDFRPYWIQHFAFSSSYPPMGQPFRPSQSLYGLAAQQEIRSSLTLWPYIHSDNTFTCSIRQPRNQLLCWDDVITSTWSQPLYSIRVLRLAFRGDRTMAFAIARLNMPALEDITFVLEHSTDINGLYLCGALLCSVRKVTFAGVCPPVLDLGFFRYWFERIFVTRIIVRFVEECGSLSHELARMP
ncbi:hypothetical protein C8F04DRAFT_1161144 [Mycena alexandri]|uniref:Uncharacterized protein n=1 Tax=Mycena alexandri TaxID=1745969 RepID=A0AAD6RWW3_9AGAR|nr:hypothetical protein C8F04DRAFT_1161144 [Mycena alexandri]